MTKIYTVDETAQILRKGRTWTWNLVRSGEIRSFKIGARRVISQDAVDEYLQRVMDDSEAAPDGEVSATDAA